MTKGKCPLCGTEFELGEEPYVVSLEFNGGENYGHISVLKKPLCRYCAHRFFPLFENLGKQLMPIFDDPWELYELNNKLKNELAALKSDMKYRR